jgi:hypothetical protein
VDEFLKHQPEPERYAAWLDEVFAEVGRRANAPVEGSGSDRYIGPYRVSHSGPQSNMGNIPWTAALAEDPLRRVRHAGTFDWRTFSPSKVADAIMLCLANLEADR